MNVKDMTVLRQNAVVTLHRNEESTKLYLNPGAYLEAHCSRYLSEGWTVFSVQLCTKEEYLNYRIDDVVESVNDTSKEREKLRQEFREHKMDFETYMTARAITNELLEGDLRKLYRLMNRLRREDLDCFNEEATQLYDMAF